MSKSKLPPRHVTLWIYMLSFACILNITKTQFQVCVCVSFQDLDTDEVLCFSWPWLVRTGPPLHFFLAWNSSRIYATTGSSQASSNFPLHYFFSVADLCFLNVHSSTCRIFTLLLWILSLRESWDQAGCLQNADREYDWLMLWKTGCQGVRMLLP